jgi:hypothetical protein
MFATHPLAEAIAEEMVIFYSSRFSQLTIGERLRRVYAAISSISQTDGSNASFPLRMSDVDNRPLTTDN